MRDWYVESFKDLRSFPPVKDANDEVKFTEMLRSVYRRHANVVPVMAKGVAELRRELVKTNSLADMPEIHQFLDGFYLSRIGIRILIGEQGPTVVVLHACTAWNPHASSSTVAWNRSCSSTGSMHCHVCMPEGTVCAAVTCAAGQHIALHEPPKSNHIGLICTKCSPVQVAQVSHHC